MFYFCSIPTRRLDARVHDLLAHRRHRRRARLPARGARRGSRRAGVPPASDPDRRNARFLSPPPGGGGGSTSGRRRSRRASPRWRSRRRTQRTPLRHGGMARLAPDRPRPRRRRAARCGQRAARRPARHSDAIDRRKPRKTQRAARGDRRGAGAAHRNDPRGRVAEGHPRQQAGARRLRPGRMEAIVRDGLPRAPTISSSRCRTAPGPTASSACRATAGCSRSTPSSRSRAFRRCAQRATTRRERPRLRAYAPTSASMSRTSPSAISCRARRRTWR